MEPSVKELEEKHQTSDLLKNGPLGAR